MRSLENIFTKIKPGDIVLKQTISSETQIEKPELVIIVGVDIWDMAYAVYYTNYKDFEFIYLLQGKGNIPEVKGFGEWMEAWNILGHWKTMPKFKNLLKAYRRKRK